jgi:hypothetical protein
MQAGLHSSELSAAIGHGFAVVAPGGWLARVVADTGATPAALNVGNFPLPDAAAFYGNTADTAWPEDGILITVVDRTALPRATGFDPSSLPLSLGPRDTSTGFAGVPAAHGLLMRRVRVSERLLEVLAQTAQAPVPARALELINDVLARVRLT